MRPVLEVDVEEDGRDRRERTVDEEVVEVIVCEMAKANWEGDREG